MSDIIAKQAEAVRHSAAGFLREFSEVSGQQKVAQTALSNATDATHASRETIMVAAANASYLGKWDDGAIETGIEAALGERNDDESGKKLSTISTFASVLNVVMHSRVRHVVPSVFAMGREAWEAERAAVKANKKAPQPLRTVWARCTFMLIDLCREVRDHGTSFASVEHIVRFAEESDPAKDAERAEKKLKQLRKQVLAMHDEFPLEALKTIADYLAKVKGTALTAARDAARQPQPEPSNLRKAEPAAAEPVAGASDIIGDALSEYNAAA